MTRTLKPTNPYFKPEHRSLFVITRKKAQSLVEILKQEFPREAAMLIPRINYELGNGTHDTHIAFYIDDDGIDEITALQYSCMQLTFTHIVIGG